jgi:hypothetical protein
MCSALSAESASAPGRRAPKCRRADIFPTTQFQNGNAFSQVSESVELATFENRWSSNTLTSPRLIKRLLAADVEFRLFAVHQKREGVGQNGRPRTRIVSGGGGRGAKFGGHCIDSVIGVVERHGARAALGIDFLHQ